MTKVIIFIEILVLLFLVGCEKSKTDLTTELVICEDPRLTGKVFYYDGPQIVVSEAHYTDIESKKLGYRIQEYDFRGEGIKFRYFDKLGNIVDKTGKVIDQCKKNCPLLNISFAQIVHKGDC